MRLRSSVALLVTDKPGDKTQFSQVYSSDDPYLETDVQFAVTNALIGQYVQHDYRSAPAADVNGTWFSLDQHFVIEPGEAKLPRPPITGKVEAAAAGQMGTDSD